MVRNNLQVQIQIGKRALGMADDDYRSFLSNTVGQTSSKGLSDGQMLKVIDGLKAKGWKNSYRGTAKNNTYKQKPKHARFVKSDNPLIRKIYVMWRKVFEVGIIQNNSKEALQAFCTRTTKSKNAPEGIYSLDWMTTKQHNKIIETLKSMHERGLEGDKK